MGHLEKSLSPSIADSPRVNVHESEREQSGISWRQFCDVRRLAAIFRGALMIVHLLGQLGLDGIEELPINNGRLLARQDLTLECHLSNVEPVAEQVGARKRTASLSGRAVDRPPVRWLVTRWESRM